MSNCIEEVVFKNESLPVEVKTQDGFTRVDLPVLGADAKKFNDLSFEKGKSDSVEVIDECELEQIRKVLHE